MEGRMGMEKTKEEMKVNDENTGRGKYKIQTEKVQKQELDVRMKKAKEEKQ
jgi:hypothetical protein